MPKNALVIMRYGPYSAVGLSVEYRTFRLEGMQGGPLSTGGPRISVCPAALAEDGHEVILEKTEDWNVVELVVNGKVVFQCNIKDLEFGGDGKLDPLCKEARIAVLSAY